MKVDRVRSCKRKEDITCIYISQFLQGNGNCIGSICICYCLIKFLAIMLSFQVFGASFIHISIIYEMLPTQLLAELLYYYLQDKNHAII